ncbi:unnamed protein product [Amoebophrya sp. A25]|nr:unnamed protein product [Amoebophrya sp. A25]|eukprot:GSA25T00008196001.1
MFALTQRFIPRWLFGYGQNVSNLDRFFAYLGMVYFWAFWSFYAQFPGLYGDDGITPVREYIDDMSPAARQNPLKFAFFPVSWLPAATTTTNVVADVGRTVVEKVGVGGGRKTTGVVKTTTAYSSKALEKQFLSQDGLELFGGLGKITVVDAAELVGFVGMFLSLLLWLYPKWRVLRTVCVIGCWQCYLAAFSVGQFFMGFQWDILLLEVGFLATFYLFSSNKEYHACVDWLFRALFVKLMFMTGIVKQTSGCPTWGNLTALEYHYSSQCIPTELAWFFHQLHPLVNRIGVAVMFCAQLAPGILLIFIPYLRKYAAALHLMLQVLIFATGNYNWFNVLSAILLWPCLGSHSGDSSSSDGESSSTFGFLSSTSGGTSSATKNSGPAYKQAAAAIRSTSSGTGSSSAMMSAGAASKRGASSLLRDLLSPRKLVRDAVFLGLTMSLFVLCTALLFFFDNEIEVRSSKFDDFVTPKTQKHIVTSVSKLVAPIADNTSPMDTILVRLSDFVTESVGARGFVWSLFHGDHLAVRSNIAESQVREYMHWYTLYGLCIVQGLFLLSCLAYCFGELTGCGIGGGSKSGTDSNKVRAIEDHQGGERADDAGVGMDHGMPSSRSASNASGLSSSGPNELRSRQMQRAQSNRVSTPAKGGRMRTFSKSNIYGDECVSAGTRKRNVFFPTLSPTSSSSLQILCRIFVYFPLALVRCAVLFVVLGLGFLPWGAMGPTNFLLQREIMQHVYQRIPPSWHVSNSYGLFRRMTGVGPKDMSKGFAGLDHTPTPSVPALIFEGFTPLSEGSSSGTWKEIEFPYAPGPVKKRPARVAPYQPRVDWQLWFGALSPQYQGQEWIVRLTYILTRGFGDGAVKELLDLEDDSTFKQIRVSRYLYDFTRYPGPPWHPRTTREMSRLTPAKQEHWWAREKAGEWMPAVGASNMGPLAKHYAWLKNDGTSKSGKKKNSSSGGRVERVSDRLELLRDAVVRKPRQWFKEHLPFLDANFLLTVVPPVLLALLVGSS